MGAGSSFFDTYRENTFLVDRGSHHGPQINTVTRLSMSEQIETISEGCSIRETEYPVSLSIPIAVTVECEEHARSILLNQWQFAEAPYDCGIEDILPDASMLDLICCATFTVLDALGSDNDKFLGFDVDQCPNGKTFASLLYSKRPTR